jgi:DNA-binding LacI/PurR family transcriptional regulator
LNISLYNLTNIDTFVFPEKIGQRSIDGLILTGYVEAEIVKKFKEFKIPMVILGRDTELAKLAPGISPDDEKGVMDILRYAYKTGHRDVLWCIEKKRRSMEKTKNVLTLLEASGIEIKIHVTYSKNGECNYQAGKPLAEEWLRIEADKRPTLIISTDQTLTTTLQELSAHGIHCPEDISLASICDSRLCKDLNPPLTAINTDMEGQAEKAVAMLIDHLDHKKPLTPEMQINDYPYQLVIRQSVKTRGSK